jgi:hypothetical protein
MASYQKKMGIWFVRFTSAEGKGTTRKIGTLSIWAWNALWLRGD